MTSLGSTHLWMRTGGFVLLAVLPLALLTGTSLSAASDVVHDSARSQVDTTARTSGLLVEQQLASVERLVESYANRSLVIDALGDGDPTGFQIPVLQQKLDQLLDNQPGLAGTFLADTAGVVRAVQPASPGVVGTDFSHRDWYRGTRWSGSTYVSEAYRTALAGSPMVVAVATPVRAPNGRVLGTLAAIVELDFLQRYANELAEAQGLELTIADRRGVVLASSSDQVVPKDPRIAAALSGRTGTQADEHLSSYRPIEHLGWAVVAEVETAEALRGLERMRRQVLLIAAGLAVLLLAGIARLEHGLRAKDRAQREVEQREAALSGVLRAATDGFIGCTPDGRVRVWNAAAEDLFGWPVEQALGQEVSRLLLTDESDRPDRSGSSSSPADAVAAMTGGRVELEAQHRDGRRFPVEVSAWASEDGDGWSVFVRDITERTTARAELEAARDEAMESSRLKSQFLANMSHEIRTPMNGVIGMSALLAGSQLTPLQQEWASTVCSSSEALLTVLNDILDVSKIEARQLHVEQVPVDLRDVVEGSAALLACTAHDKGLELSCYVDPRLPDLVVGDPVRLRQIVMNLLGNAVKFTERGHVSVELLVSGSGPDDGLELQLVVSDTGIGMSEDVLARAFEPFVQADSTTTRRFGGTGLGLPITQQLVELMHGSISASSRPDQGSTLAVRLPTAAVPGAVPPPAPASLRGSRIAITGVGSTTAGALARVLEAWGCTLVDGEPSRTACDVLLVGAEQLAHVPPGSGAVVALIAPGRDAVADVASLPLPARSGALARVLQQAVSGAPSDGAPALRDSEAADPTCGTTLVVDDNLVNQKVARYLLERMGWTVQLAADGRQALDLLATTDVDVVFMDCQMPVLDGYGATEELRQREVGTGRRTPVIALTASAMASDRARCLAAGMDDHVSKPLRQADLQRVLTQFGPAPAPLLVQQRRPEHESLPVLDEAVLRDLDELGDGVLDGLLQLYLDDLVRWQCSVPAAQDAKGIAAAAHALMGTSATMGAARLTTEAARVEAAACTGRRPELDVLAVEVEHVVTDLQLRLHRDVHASLS